MSRPTVAIVAALAVLLSGLLLVLVHPVPLVPWTGTVTPEERTVLSLSGAQGPAYAQLRAQLAGMAPADVHLIALGYERALNHTTAEELLTYLQVHPLGAQENCVLAGIAIGFALGGPLGALAGAAVGISCFGFLSPASDTQQQSKQWTEGMLAELGNELNGTATQTADELSALNLSENALMQQAASAALDQIGNTTFDMPLDLLQGNVAQQLGGFEAMAYTDLGEPLVQFDKWYETQDYGGGAYSSDPTNVSIYSSTLTGGSAPLAYSGNDIFSGDEEAFGGGPYWIGSGNSTIAIAPQSACGGQFTYTENFANYAGGENSSATVSVTGSSKGFGACYGEFAFPGHTGVYVPSGTNIYVAGLDVGPSYDNGQGGIFVGLPSGLYEPSSIGVTSGGFQYPLHYPVLAALPGYLYGLDHAAASVGYAYWQFIHSTLGCFAISCIPADCVIPYPEDALPPGIDYSKLTPDQVLALYYAWMHGLGKTFNQSLNASTFCGAHTIGNIGNVTGINLAVNATGDVFIPQAQDPKENPANPGTWAYSGNLELMPLVRSVSIPVGQTWQPPKVSPLAVYVFNFSTSTSQLNGTYLGNVVGNASSLSGSSTVDPAYYAIYLTTCHVNGVSTSTCNVTRQTIGNESNNLTCPGPPGSCTPTPPLLQWVNPFANFLSWLGSLFGFGGGLGSLIGFLIVFVIAIVAIWVVVRIGSAALGRPRSTSSPGVRISLGSMHRSSGTRPHRRGRKGGLR